MLYKCEVAQSCEIFLTCDRALTEEEHFYVLSIEYSSASFSYYLNYELRHLVKQFNYTHFILSCHYKPTTMGCNRNRVTTRLRR